MVKIDTKKREISEILGALEDPLIDENLSLSLFDRVEGFFKRLLEFSATLQRNLKRAILKTGSIILTSLLSPLTPKTLKILTMRFFMTKKKGFCLWRLLM